MGAAAATAGNAAGVGGSGSGDMQRGGGGGEESQDQEDGPQHRRAEEGSEALTGSSKEARAMVEVVRIVGFGHKTDRRPLWQESHSGSQHPAPRFRLHSKLLRFSRGLFCLTE